MDEIQRTLVKVGRKDLAQKYYLKTAAGAFKGLSRNVIRQLVMKGYGDDSKEIELSKIKPLDADTAIILKSQGKLVLTIINEGYGGGYSFYDVKGNRLPSSSGINNAKKMNEFLTKNNIVYDKIISLEKMQIKRKDQLYGDELKLTPAELAKKRREKEMGTPLIDMGEVKNKVWVERFKKSIPKLEALVKTLLGYDLKANIKGTISNSKYFNIEFTPEFFGKDLGVFKFALKKAGFYTYCNPSPSEAEIWFPIKLGWQHHDGGTNGGDTKNMTGQSIDLWYVPSTGDWKNK